MWYQFNSDNAFIIAGALARYRDALQRDLDAGRVATSDWDWCIKEIVRADRLRVRFDDFGRQGSFADVVRFVRVSADDFDDGEVLR